jgi:aspartyl-tRNA(Asn)/glutamyl-tRNA(Gln) amidotransferase subunit B
VVELPLARKQRFMRDYQLPAGDAEVFKNDVMLGGYFEQCAKALFSKNFSEEKNSKLLKAIANLLINNLRAKMSAQNKLLAEMLLPEEEKQQLQQKEISELIARMMTSEEEKNRKEHEEQGASITQMLSPLNLKFQPIAVVELVDLTDTRIISVSAQQTVFSEMFETGKAPAAIVQEKGLAQVSDTGAIEKFCDEAIAANPGPAKDFKSGKVAALNFLKGQVMKLSKGKANPALVGEILERKLKN